MSPNSQTYITELIAQTMTHEDWKIFVEFGIETLLANPTMLMEVVFAEARSEMARRGEKFHTARQEFSEAVRIFNELNLKIVCADPCPVPQIGESSAPILQLTAPE